MPKDTEIESAVQGLIKRHGSKATLVAQLRVEACECDGQSAAANIWRRIVEKICEIDK